MLTRIFTRQPDTFPCLPAQASAPVPKQPEPEIIEIFLSPNVNWAYIAWWRSVNKNFCIYCHCRLDDGNRTVDHIVPMEQCRKLLFRDLRASFNQINTAPCCFACNMKKGNKLLFNEQQPLSL